MVGGIHFVLPWYNHLRLTGRKKTNTSSIYQYIHARCRELIQKEKKNKHRFSASHTHTPPPLPPFHPTPLPLLPPLPPLPPSLLYQLTLWCILIMQTSSIFTRSGECPCSQNSGETTERGVVCDGANYATIAFTLSASRGGPVEG